jgi:hypothetical protein
MAIYTLLNSGPVPSNTTVPFHSEHLSEFKSNHVQRVESTGHRRRISFTPSVPQEQAGQLRIQNPLEGVPCQRVPCQPSTSQKNIYSSPTKALCRFYQINNNFTMSTTNPMDSHPVQAPLQLETQQDNHSEISPLQCGSIVPVAVNQTIQDQPFNIPHEITIRVRVPISMGEQQAESDPADSYHMHSPISFTKSCDTMETQPVESDEDNQSKISSLQVGSVLRLVDVDPATQNQPMHPPQEITIRLPPSITIGEPEKEKCVVPDWLRVDKQLLPPSSIPTLARGRSAPQQRGSPRTPTRPKHVRVDSCPNVYFSPETAMATPARSLIVNGKVQHNIPHREDKDSILLSKVRPALIQHRNLSGTISAGSIVGKSSFHTVPTDTSSSGSSAEVQGYYQHLRAQRTLSILNDTPTRRRRSIVRSELKYVWNRVSSPLKQFVNKDTSVEFTRASGCLT